MRLLPCCGSVFCFREILWLLAVFQACKVVHRSSLTLFSLAKSTQEKKKKKDGLLPSKRSWDVWHFTYLTNFATNSPETKNEQHNLMYLINFPVFPVNLKRCTLQNELVLVALVSFVMRHLSGVRFKQTKSQKKCCIIKTQLNIIPFKKKEMKCVPSGQMSNQQTDKD